MGDFFLVRRRRDRYNGGPARLENTSHREIMMRKITLQLESLHVDSFATTPLLSGEGTVVAFEECEQTAWSEIPPKTQDCASNQATCDTCQGPNCPRPA
jgi:hypothetical protein